MQKKIIGIVVAFVLFVGLPAFVYMLTSNQLGLGYNQGYEPTQPIAFSHKKHAGDNKIACQYCHTSTEVSRHASVPSLNICMNCHLTIKTDKMNKTDSAEIQKIKQAYQDEKPVEWEKVHLLPDHVKFNHSAHIRAGKDCKTCHGPIEQMTKVYQYSDLSMGWCVNCHRQPENNAPVTCGTCHY